MKIRMAKNFSSALFMSLIVVACASPTSVQNTRTPEQMRADLQTATTELQGSYEVIESRNDDYNFTTYKTQRADVKISGNTLAVRLIGQAKTFSVYATACNGSVNMSNEYYSLFCTEGQPGISSVWLYKEYWDNEIKTGALLGGFKPLQVRKGDYLFSYSESPKGRPHYYKLRKSIDAATLP